MSIAALRRFFDDRKGNVLITFAVLLIPTIYLAGMTIDYISATRKKAKLDALADAAVLAALTPNMLHQSSTVAQTAAQNVFNAQAKSLQGLNFDPKTDLTITVNDTITTRNVTVSYSASSQNYFPGVLKFAAMSLASNSHGSASFPPNIDFYLLLDNSGSMAIPATQAGIDTMLANTKGQDGKGVGCAFACHQSNPSDLNPQNPGGVDNYQLAINLGVSTRIQLVASAVSQLATTATNTAAQNQSTYRMATYTFNYNGAQEVTHLTSSLSTVGTQAQSIDVMEVYQNNWLTSTVNNSDADTDFGKAMSTINGIMPTPGTGLSGQQPQEILFIVSDGVDDANNPSPACTQKLSGSRCQQPFNATWCTTVKNRGIKIAVLYTVYLPMTSNSWYNSWVAPYQKWNNPAGNDGIATAMQNCATPGLFNSVTTDGDIASALNKLFQAAVQMAHLTQ
jgi:Flp pilus assembly protein TadG